jgi:hypothetical protein
MNKLTIAIILLLFGLFMMFAGYVEYKGMKDATLENTRKNHKIAMIVSFSVGGVIILGGIILMVFAFKKPKPQVKTQTKAQQKK